MKMLCEVKLHEDRESVPEELTPTANKLDQALEALVDAAPEVVAFDDEHVRELYGAMKIYGTSLNTIHTFIQKN